MPLNQGPMSYSIGRDCSVVLIHPLAPGGRVDLANVTTFEATAEYTSVRSKRLDGNRLSADIPDGWTGSFGVDRNGPALDDLMVLIEAAWRQAGVLYGASVYQYVTEPDGSVSTYHYTEASLQFPGLGSWQGDAIVSQRITFSANRRLKV